MEPASHKPFQHRLAWENRFHRPTFDELCKGLTRQASELIGAARDRLRRLPGVTEELSWEGLPWRWTFLYRMPGDNGRAWAYLVPDPAKPLIALPLTQEMLSSLALHRVKKHVKDGVAQARLVNGVHWATWEITGKTQLAEVMQLVEQKQRLTGKQGGISRSWERSTT